MKNFLSKTGLLILFATLIIWGCQKDKIDCNDLNVTTDNYSGSVDITSRGEDPAADFTGNGDSGTFIFEWCNPQKRAQVNFDITTKAGGSVQMILKDDKGDVVMDRTRPQNGNDSYSGVTDVGESGVWTVEVYLTDVDGDGSFSMNPGD